MRVLIAPPSGMTESLPHCSFSGTVAGTSGSQLGPGSTALKKNEFGSQVPLGRHCSGGIGGGAVGSGPGNTQRAQSLVGAPAGVWATTRGAQLSTSTLLSVVYCLTAIH